MDWFIEIAQKPFALYNLLDLSLLVALGSSVAWVASALIEVIKNDWRKFWRK